MQKYLKIEFIQRKENWGQQPNHFTDIKLPARDCTEKDFGNDEKSRELFREWVGFRMYCPDVPKNSSLYL